MFSRAAAAFAFSRQTLSSATHRCVASSLTRSVPQLTGTVRFFSLDVTRHRNIGISAHIDSGKTTLTERILFYSGRVDEIHEVRGKDGVGAKMDSMDLEREKGITIQSAATYLEWTLARDKTPYHVNVIDTPGHVDFTIEVERALRVLDGAVLVICGVAGVQSQSMTVDRQMKRYGVPRIAFVNKLDRMGAEPWRPLQGMREVLRLNAHPLQIPIGHEEHFLGVVDLLEREAIYYDGPSGEQIRREPCPPELVDEMEQRRAELVEAIADLDDDIAELVMEDAVVETPQLRAAIREQTIALKFVPVMMGSAFKNKGVQTLLDGVVDYLPQPDQVTNKAFDQTHGEDADEVTLVNDASLPVVALAFKLEESRFGQLTYMRVYQGQIKKGMSLTNVVTGKSVKIPRLLRMHSNEMVDIDVAPAGEIVAMFGVDCASGHTFTSDGLKYTMSSMYVPDAVMSLAISVVDRTKTGAFGKALARFIREDPTFRVEVDPETNETIISGMGELHLDIYVQRMLREYNCEVKVGTPRVKYRETVTKRATFSYLHKKQSGGSGQYGKVEGFLEPTELGDDPDHPDTVPDFVFENHLSGNTIPPEFIPAIEKGFREACAVGQLTGHPVQGVRVVLQDGQAHPVDSNEVAFRSAAAGAFREGVAIAAPQVLEPVMKVEIVVPEEFQGNVIGGLTKRGGSITSTTTNDGSCTIISEMPLAKMFGYSTELRSATEGKGEFSMEYHDHQAVFPNEQADLCAAYQASRGQKKKDD